MWAVRWVKLFPGLPRERLATEEHDQGDRSSGIGALVSSVLPTCTFAMRTQV